MAVEYFPFPQGVGKDVYHYNQDNLASGAESFYMGKPIKPEHRSYLTWPERYLGTATDTLLERVLVKRYADPTSVSPINLENISPKFTVAWNDRYPNQRAGDMMIMGCLKIANVAADWAINRFGKESYYLPQLSINLSTDQLTRLEKTFKDDSIGGLVCTMVNPRTKEFFSSIDEFAYEVITNPQFLFDSSVFDRDSEFKAEIEQKGLRVPPQLRIKKIIDLLRSVNYIDLESKPTQRLLMFVVDLSTQEFLDAYKINANKAMFDPATIKAKLRRLMTTPNARPDLIVLKGNGSDEIEELLESLPHLLREDQYGMFGRLNMNDLLLMPYQVRYKLFRLYEAILKGEVSFNLVEFEALVFENQRRRNNIKPRNLDKQMHRREEMNQVMHTLLAIVNNCLALYSLERDNLPFNHPLIPLLNAWRKSNTAEGDERIRILRTIVQNRIFVEGLLGNDNGVWHVEIPAPLIRWEYVGELNFPVITPIFNEFFDAQSGEICLDSPEPGLPDELKIPTDYLFNGLVRESRNLFRKVQIQLQNNESLAVYEQIRLSEKRKRNKDKKRRERVPVF